MRKPLVIILMGSKADLPHSQKIAEAVAQFGLEVVMRIGSAHKTPSHVQALLQRYEDTPVKKVYITVAGRSNALSGFVDAAVTVPVIACPPPSDSFSGADIFSSLRMPSGVAPAVVLEPANAALLAAKILGLTNADIAANIVKYQRAQAEKIMSDDIEINKTLEEGD